MARLGLLSFAIAVLCCAAGDPALRYFFSFLPDPSQELSFTPDYSSPVVLAGRSPKECGVEIPEFSEEEQVDGIALAIRDKGQGCYTDERYAHGDFPVRAGYVGDFRAYEISPFTQSASEFAASGQAVYFLLPSVQAYKVYIFSKGNLAEIGELAASGVSSNGTFTRTSIQADQLKETSVFVVLPATEVIPAPPSMTLSGAIATECNGELPSSEIFVGELALVNMKGQGTCWTDGRYNNEDFLVERGHLVGTDGSKRRSYKIHPPQTLSTEWALSPVNVYLSSSEADDLTVWAFDEQGFSALDTFTSTGENLVPTSVAVEHLTKPLVFVLEASSVHMTDWPLVSDSTEAAWLAGNAPDVSLSGWRFQVGGRPFVPAEDWPQGPGTHSGNYGSLKHYFPVSRADGKEGVVWQDMESGGVQMTWLASDLSSAETTQLIVVSTETLVAATSDGAVEIVFIMIGDTPEDKYAVTSGSIFKFSSLDGSKVLEAALTTQDFNIHSCCNPASISWDTAHSGTIGVQLGRTMTKGGDGLNHQGGFAFVLDPRTLEVVFDYGQTASHSFGSSVIPSVFGSFLGMDLGDNYPRGVQTYRFNGSERSIQHRLVYAFKAKHATQSCFGQDVPPVYEEISTAETTFYKCSNDNYVYTELGHPGLVETSDDGILVFFAGEQPPLDNAKVGAALNSARNIGFVKVPRDLQSTEVMSPGPEELGGFYNFGGGWSEQRNLGVYFLTSQTDIDQSVSRLKTAHLESGEILLIFEIWSRETYNRTEYLVVDQEGAIQVPQETIGYDFQLPFADDPVVLDGRAVMYTGTTLGQLVRYELCATGTCPGPATTSTTMSADPDKESSGSEISRASSSGVLSFLILPLLAAPYLPHGAEINNCHA